MTRTVLIVEDDALVRMGFAMLLEDAGFAVSAFDCGQAALDHVDGAGSADLLVTDLGLPDMDGLDLIGDLRRRLGAIVPAIILTGDTQAPDRLRGEGLTVLVKPVDPDDFVRLVERITAAA